MDRRPALLMIALVLASSPARAGQSDPLRTKQWGLHKVEAPSAWATGRGKGVVIAIVDSGVDLRHEDLKGRLVAGHDFVDDDGTPQDREGHGTHVAGIAAAAAGNGRGVAGVAPGARIMPVRVLDEDGSGSAADVAVGIKWAVDHGADVINLSLGDVGEPLFGPAFSSALDYAWSRGVIPVVSAGNEYLLSSGYADEPAIVVGATNRNDGKPEYSSGVGQAKWGMAAPGGAGSPLAPAEDDIVSTHWRAGSPNAYAYLAGTSMAAPHVSGAAAVLRGLGLTAQQTVTRLLETARDVGPAGRDSTFGRGRLDLAAAVRGLSGAAGAGPAPGGGAVPSGASPPAPAGAAGSAPPPTLPSPVGPAATPAAPGQTGAGQRVPVEEEQDDFPVAVFATGLVAVLLAVLIAWALFRPNPPE
jgi:subtilisin family serine protease